MPLIDEPFFPQPRESHGFVRFGIILSLSAVHQWAQDTLVSGPLPLPARRKSRNHPAAGMEQIAGPSKSGDGFAGPQFRDCGAGVKAAIARALTDQMYTFSDDTCSPGNSRPPPP